MLSGFVQGGGVSPGPHTLMVGNGGQTNGKGMLHGDLASFLAAHLLASVAVPLLCHRSPEPHPLTPQEDSAGLRATLRRGLEASPCREVTGTCVTPTCSHPCHF